MGLRGQFAAQRVRRAAVTSAAMGALVGTLCLAAPAHANPWDSAISNSYWYVPVPQLLAYAAPGTSFANPIPIGDQTLWTLGTSTNGVFSGTSSAQLAIGPVVTTSNSNIQRW